MLTSNDFRQYFHFIWRKFGTLTTLPVTSGELKQPLRRGHKNITKFAYLTTNAGVLHSLYVHFLFLYISLSFVPYQGQEMTCFADSASACQRIFIIFLSNLQNRRYRFDFRVGGVHFASSMPSNNREIVAGKRSYFFSWRPRCRELKVTLMLTDFILWWLLCVHILHPSHFLMRKSLKVFLLVYDSLQRSTILRRSKIMQTGCSWNLFVFRGGLISMQSEICHWSDLSNAHWLTYCFWNREWCRWRRRWHWQY